MINIRARGQRQDVRHLSGRKLLDGAAATQNFNLKLMKYNYTNTILTKIHHNLLLKPQFKLNIIEKVTLHSYLMLNFNIEVFSQE